MLKCLWCEKPELLCDCVLVVDGKDRPMRDPAKPGRLNLPEPGKWPVATKTKAEVREMYGEPEPAGDDDLEDYEGELDDQERAQVEGDGAEL